MSFDSKILNKKRMVPHKIKGKSQLGVNKFTGLVYILLKSILFFSLKPEDFLWNYHIVIFYIQ